MRISGKFQISQEGAKEFVELAIINWVKTNYSIQISNDSLGGNLEVIQKLQGDVLDWTTEEFEMRTFRLLVIVKISVKTKLTYEKGR